MPDETVAVDESGGPRSVLASSPPQALARALDLLLGRPHSVGMLSPSTSPGARLVAPWFKLWNEIRYSIGEDPNVQIDPLNTNSSPYLISIHVSDSTKASALASILLPTYSFGNVTVNVQVDNSGTVVQPSALATNQDVNRAINRALATNTLFVGAFPTPDGRIGVLFARAIVQFFNDDSTELYSNFNASAAAVFKDVLTLSYERVSLVLGTQMPGLIQQLGAQSK